MTSAAERTEARAASLREKSRTAERARKLTLAELTNTAHGRSFLWGLIADANVFSQTYVPDSFDRTAFGEGQRSRGLALLSDILRWFPSSYITMTKENNPTADLEEAAPQENDDE